jgi:hypothetical protein
MKKSLRVLIGLLNLGLLFMVSSCNIETSWTTEDHYGEITIKNESSDPLTEIKICEYSDESGLKTVDTNPLSAGGSRTYRNQDGVKLEYTTIPIDGDFKSRHIKIRYNNAQKTKRVYLSEGHNVEVVVNDSGLTVTNPIYDPSSGQKEKK